MAEHANGPGASRAAASSTEGHTETNAADTSTAQTQGNLHSALKYAELGWHVHPTHWIRPGGRCSCTDPGCALGQDRKAGKHPLLNRWRDRATTNPSTIRSWWHRAPAANIAVATGPASNIIVLDVDGSEGEAALIELERLHGQQLPDLFVQQWTGSGRGWQALFAYPSGRTVGNTASTIARNIDSRGGGGYILVPCSTTVQPYRWADDRDPWTLPPEPPPPWLVELLDPAPVPKPKRETRTTIEVEDRYIRRALATELDAVAGAAEGQRNRTLNNSSLSLFRFVEDGQLDATAIVDGLEDAARAAGLTDIEISRTIRSAARARGISL